MRIGAAIREDGTIVPLSDGRMLIVYDTETAGEQRHVNPGYGLKEGRRAAATEFFRDQGVTLVCSVPQTFCPNSYETARSNGMRFLRLPEGATWNQVRRERLWEKGDVTEEISPGLLFLPPKPHSARE